ncbi:ATP-binding protein [Streptomyces sp. NPDC002851]
MDPMHRGPEQHGRDGGASAAKRGGDAGDGEDRADAKGRPPRDPLMPEPAGPAPVRPVQLVSGDFLLTVNPVDGSEIEPCPPGRQPSPPRKWDTAERAERRRAARPPVPPGPVLATPPLLERQEERERLVRLLARGRSVRLTGPSGSGRTALLESVAEDCADLAPDGVVRLSGHHRTPTELLFELYASVYATVGDGPLLRPDDSQVLEFVRDIGAVVVLDDLEFGGAALEELLAATPECAFLLAATPDVAAPLAESHLEEVFLGGLGRGGGLELLERSTGRPLTDDEAALAGDLWFESEGLPLRFVQAGALLRQRDQIRAEREELAAEADQGGAAVSGASGDAERGHDVPLPLPTFAEAAAPAAVLAERLSESARATLEFALALGGEVPHQTHLPALVGDTHADAALGELVAAALVTPVGARYRLAAGVCDQLRAAGYAERSRARAHTAAQHYAWWVGHASVTPRQAATQADAVVATLSALVPDTDSGRLSAAVLLARTAAPVLAAGFAWGAWERALRSGQEAARLAGEVAEEAYFHHELGILALLGGNLDRARAELEASIGLRRALADKRGTVAGRRALALVTDRSGGVVYGESATPSGGFPAPPLPLSSPALDDEVETVVTRHAVPAADAEPTPVGGTPRAVVGARRRNLVAAGAVALLAVVLGTVVTLGAMSDQEEGPADTVRPQQTTDEQGENDDQPSDKETTDDATSRPADPESVPETAGSGGPSDGPTTSGEPSGDPTTPSDDPSTPSGDPTTPSDDPTTPSGDPTTPSDDPTTSKPPTSTPPPSTQDPEPTESGKPSPSWPGTSSAQDGA